MNEYIQQELELSLQSPKAIKFKGSAVLLTHLTQIEAVRFVGERLLLFIDIATAYDPHYTKCMAV